MRISDWSSDVCSSDLFQKLRVFQPQSFGQRLQHRRLGLAADPRHALADIDRRFLVFVEQAWVEIDLAVGEDRKSVVEGKSVSVSVDLGGRRDLKKKTQCHRTDS